ncbi:PTS sugar transporter subunit IIA [Lapidilactobacillus dextrinicus]|uniref:PTS sugar transporter subunit IIA n=1 Tax=Lapidilactobacillus dextrinicus TaxID=51664 RepID=UPI0022E8AF7C|nr:PTS sugar transporter subunit IIA [Lapidilactobacillus dextrinicus]
MIPILLCMHGNASTELRASAEMICGVQDQCETIDFHMGQDIKVLQDQLDEKIVSLGKHPLCLTDLRGGTPFNTLVTLTQKYPDISIIAGTNIPMLLQAFIYRNQLDREQLIEEIISAGKSGIFNYKKEEIIEEDF